MAFSVVTRNNFVTEMTCLYNILFLSKYVNNEEVLFSVASLVLSTRSFLVHSIFGAVFGVIAKKKERVNKVWRPIMITFSFTFMMYTQY